MFKHLELKAHNIVLFVTLGLAGFVVSPPCAARARGLFTYLCGQRSFGWYRPAVLPLAVNGTVTCIHAAGQESFGAV